MEIGADLETWDCHWGLDLERLTTIFLSTDRFEIDGMGWDEMG